MDAFLFDPDPLVMYLVAPSRYEGPAGAMLADAAGACVRCAEQFEADPAWEGAFRAWEGTAVRKVCLRARPAELERLREAGLDHAACGALLCFPPRGRAAAEPELASLRAHTGGPVQPGEPSGVVLSAGAMPLLINEGLGLTAGKACAQVGHAVLIARRAFPGTVVERWRVAGFPLGVALVSDTAFARAASELPMVAVRDGGLTQVAPGTETVLAGEPGVELPAWLLDAAAPVL